MTDRSVLVRLRADISQYLRGLSTAGTATSAFVKQLDSADTRMSNMVQSMLAIAPAAVPIAGLAVPALAGLTLQAGLAATAIGANVIAFQGMGDALDALNKYRLEPTAENYAKITASMDTLSRAGQDFTFFLDGLRPRLQAFQDVAQEGLFPGMRDGITEVLRVQPELERLLSTVSETTGDLFASAGDNLNDSRWVEFFNFLEREAGPTLSAMGQATGYVAEGFAQMMIAADPLSDMFTAGMLNGARDFAQWAAELDESQGFQDMVAYIRDNGPQAMETLGAIGGAFVELVEAAAPVGAVSLPIIEAVADVFSAVAETPAGPILIGAAAGLAAVSRSVALYNAANGSALLTMLRGTAATGAAAGAGATAASSGLGRLNQAISLTKTAGAGIGLIALTATDVDEKLGVANTAMLSLTGAMVGGVPGAVAGGTIGAFMDLRAAGERAGDAMERFDDAIAKASSVTGYTAEVSRLRDEIDAVADTWMGKSGLALEALAQSGFFEGKKAEDIIGGMSDIFGGSESLAAASAAGLAEGNLLALEDAARRLADAQGMASRTTTDLDRALAAAEPAMNALGITTTDLVNAASAGTYQLPLLLARISNWQAQADSTAGRTDALAAAFAGLRNEMVPTATAAQQLEAAMDSLLGPALGLSQATDAWHAGLDDLEDQLHENRNTLVGQSDAARQNRDAVRGQVVNLRNLVVAMAEADEPARRIVRTFREQRQALIDNAKAAGLNRDEVKDLLRTLNLTPKTIRTIIDAVTDPAERKRKALMEHLIEIDRFRATPILDANADPAHAAMDEAWAHLQRLNGQRATMYVHTVRTSSDGVDYVSGGKPRTSSAIGDIFGPVRHYAWGDVANGHQPMLARGHTRVWNEPETGGEAYIPLRNDGRRPRAKSILEQTAAMFGGSVSYFAAGGGHRWGTNGGPGGGGSTRLRLDLGELKVRGTLDTPWGPAQIEGIARDVAQAEIDADRRFDDVRAGGRSG